MKTTRKRRWWQFGLRDCLWLTVVVALTLGWWVRECGFQRERSKSEAERASLQATLDDREQWIGAYKAFSNEAAQVADGPTVLYHAMFRNWILYPDGRLKRVDPPPTP